MKLTSLLALALLITGCSAVHVREAPVDQHFAPRLHARATALDDEARLATMAELHLSKALDADRKRMPTAALHHYTEVARFSYAHLFFARREELRTQVRDWYNLATERLTSLLFTGVDQSQVRLGAVRLFLPYGQLAPQELIPASRLAFDGIRNTYRRDGFGAAFVAVAAPADSAVLHESLFLSATVVLRFPGATLEEVLNAPDAMLDVYDPYRYETAQLGDRVVPLAANFTAPYALWLSRSQFHREARRALFSRSTKLAQPRIYAMQPYDPQRRTIVLIHGLASGPDGWVNLVNEIMGDEALRRRYQVWQVFYPTNLPIPENVRNIRAALLDALHTLDPDGTAPASQHMTLVGHSMGGVIARLLVVDSPDGLWQTIFDRPIDLERRQKLAVLEPYLTLSPLPQVDRAIFLASPHRGSPMAHAWIGRAAARLVRLPASVLQTLGSVVDAIATEVPVQADTLRHRQLSSVQYATPASPACAVGSIVDQSVVPKGMSVSCMEYSARACGREYKPCRRLHFLRV